MPPVRITVEVDASQAQRVLQAVERSLSGVGDTAQRASEKSSNWRGAIDSIGDFGLKAWGVWQTLGMVREKIEEVIDRGIDVSRVEYTFEQMAGGASEAERALMNMRRSTFGTVADFDLMQLASTALSVGLVRNVDDLGEFASAARTLGMTSIAGSSAVSELTLAMANMSTRRFDQLGLSIDNFNANLENVRGTAHNLSQEQMWRAAFWQTVQDRVAQVGGVAHQLGSNIEWMEAQTTNLGDEAQVAATTIVDQAAGTVRAFSGIVEAGTEAHRQFAVNLALTASDYEDFARRFTEARGVDLSLFAQPPSEAEFNEVRAVVMARRDELYAIWSTSPEGEALMTSPLFAASFEDMGLQDQVAYLEDWYDKFVDIQEAEFQTTLTELGGAWAEVAATAEIAAAAQERASKGIKEALGLDISGLTKDIHKLFELPELEDYNLEMELSIGYTNESEQALNDLAQTLKDQAAAGDIGAEMYGDIVAGLRDMLATGDVATDTIEELTQKLTSGDFAGALELTQEETENPFGLQDALDRATELTDELLPGIAEQLDTVPEDPFGLVTATDTVAEIQELAGGVLETLSAGATIPLDVVVSGGGADELGRMLAPHIAPYITQYLGDIGQRNAPSGPASYGTRGSGTGAARPAA